MLTIERMNRFLRTLKTGDLLQEEWAGDGWLGNERPVPHGDIFRVESILPGDDGWLGAPRRLPRLIARDLCTGELVNLLSENRCAFRSQRFQSDTSRFPYLVLTPDSLTDSARNVKL